MQRTRRLLLTLWVLLLLLLPDPQTNRYAAAQEGGPQCPPGFEWERMSGVGCVQADCAEIAHAHYSYTRSCICNEGYRACHELVDTSGVNCGRNCPNSRLIACIDPEGTCPGEEPAPRPQPDDSEPIAPPADDDPSPPDISPNDPDGPGTDVDPIPDLIEDLDNGLKAI